MKQFSWKTPEYPWKEKSRDWYWIVGIISAALAATSAILGNFLFGLIIAISAFSLALFSTRRPKTVSVEVNEKGVIVDRTLYPYAALDAFGIDETRENDARLILKSKKAIMPLITIPLAHDDKDGIRALMSAHIKEEIFETTLSQAIFERLGF